MSIEEHFDPTFVAKLALNEKQVQQSYRPTIGIHKWFARRPGSVFRSLLLSEFNCQSSLNTCYWQSHQLKGIIADPFMGGGTPIIEANRLGFSVLGTDINPMAYWIVRQTLDSLNIKSFLEIAETVALDVEKIIGDLYHTRCVICEKEAVVKYFLWVKTEICPFCGIDNDLFPGYLLAENVRHSKNVVLCSHCGFLNEYDNLPTYDNPGLCKECKKEVQVDGKVHLQSVQCKKCQKKYSYTRDNSSEPHRNRMWALEYYCTSCKLDHTGRFFKKPDEQDLNLYIKSLRLLSQEADLPIPNDEIPTGDETNRLHHWGYRYYKDMFNKRQLLGLGILLKRILLVEETKNRNALLTVFSDFLRYQNMLCRYDTYGLKCQDIFSVHGFPVGLIQCENNILGIQKVGSGSFRHFIEKYRRAKEYCEKPFEKQPDQKGGKKLIAGESILAHFVDTFPENLTRQAQLVVSSAEKMPLPVHSLDGVFTDPPYFDNIQYAELIDFCFVWLRLGLHQEFPSFIPLTTRTPAELTGNITSGKGLEHFTQGISSIFQHYAPALKPGAPFVFTYHHNDPYAYVPLIVAILDSGMNCTATLPTAAEMNASLHISGTSSSVLDTIFVCRIGAVQQPHESVEACLIRDINVLGQSGMQLTKGDIRCLTAGHIARLVINQQYPTWNSELPLNLRMEQAKECIIKVEKKLELDSLKHLYAQPLKKKDKKARKKHETTV